MRLVSRLGDAALGAAFDAHRSLGVPLPVYGLHTWRYISKVPRVMQEYRQVSWVMQYYSSVSRVKLVIQKILWLQY
jgi:hypothetical protein